MLLAALTFATACSDGPPAAARGEMVATVGVAQEKCYRLIHHDTFAYEACVRGLSDRETVPTPARLGIEYFGWVGALNSVRVGMPGAEASAHEFLRRYRTTQRALRVDDRVLCEVIPGDCDARLAWMQKMEASPPPARADGDDDAGPAHRD